jgi:hypothetical protein
MFYSTNLERIDFMENISTRELFSQLQNKLIIDLKENEMLCPECKGLRFVLVENNGKGYIESCRRCYTGKLYVCKHCGKGNRTDHCDCKEAQQERDYNFHLKQAQKNAEAYQKAEKINYKDYDGYYIFDSNECLKTQEDLEEWIYDRLSEGEDVPEFLWAVEGTPHFSIDLKDVINDKCEDGYEDMYDNLNIGSSFLLQAQILIDQWEIEQGESLCIFNETYKKAVIIKDLIDEISKSLDPI